MFFSAKENSSYGYFYKFFKAGSGSAFKKQLDEKLLDPDPKKNEWGSTALGQNIL